MRVRRRAGAAPPERCFDAERHLELPVAWLAHSGEPSVAEGSAEA